MTAVEISKTGIKKINEQAKDNNLNIKIIQCDFAEFQINQLEKQDIIFSAGSLHYINIDRRKNIFTAIKDVTVDNGLNVIRIFVSKPYLTENRSKEEIKNLFQSGELMGYYKEWEILFINEDEKNCTSGSIPHRHIRNTIISRKVGHSSGIYSKCI